MKSAVILALLCVVLAHTVTAKTDCASATPVFPPPFFRALTFTFPLPLHGDDVTIAQNLLLRSPFVQSMSPPLNVTSQYDTITETAVRQFQIGNGLQVTGVFECYTAQKLLDLHMDDGYVDDGTILPGYLYKVHVPVFHNRSVETVATLYDSQMNILHQFIVRTHGQNDKDGDALNQFAGDGSTPTGLSSFDLNSPEPDPVSYGPYPINRAVQGLKGNAAIVISDIRDGILLHTGEWANWNPSMPMPNSHGCIHGHPDDIKKVWQILINLGVTMHQNTGGKLPYPYQPQGLLSVELVNDQ